MLSLQLQVDGIGHQTLQLAGTSVLDSVLTIHHQQAKHSSLVWYLAADTLLAA